MGRDHLTSKRKKPLPPPDPWPRDGGIPPNEREPCKKQVYTEYGIAAKTAAGLRPLGVRAWPYRCRDCGFIHLKEEPATNGNGTNPGTKVPPPAKMD